MRDSNHPPRQERSAALAARAARQYGVVAVWQLRELGFDGEAVRRLVAARRLHPLYRGVYAVGHRALPPRGRLLAAVYAGGPKAVASHHDAAWLWELGRARGRAFHLTVAARGRRSSKGLAVHCVRTLHPEDIAVAEGIPVTSVARTLVDLGAVLPLDRLRRAFEEADRRALLDAAAVERACGRGRGRRGVAEARRALAEYTPDPPKTRSEAEAEFFEFCDEIGVRRPASNVWIEGQEVDAAWIEERVAVEIDSWEYHRTRAAFERDRARTEQLLAAGWRPIRVTPRRIAQVEPLRTNLLSLLGISG